MVALFIAILVAVLVGGLLVVNVRLDRERRALLDRLLVSNSIMPVTPAPPVAAKKEVDTAQRIKFKLYP